MIDIITHPVFLWVNGFILVSGFLLWVTSLFVASYCAYTQTLKRRSQEHWGRETPTNLTPQAREMYDIGLRWGEENEGYKKDVHIQRSGCNLYGEYYDFGSDKCAMILSGRTEGLRYGYYFAIPYAKCGYNILVVDARAHGLSDGEYNTVGFEESLDDIEWVKFLQREYGIRSVVFHGICIGAAGGMYVLTGENCPDCIDGIVTEGMFANFAESVKNHMIEQKRPTLFMIGLIDMWMKKYTGHSMRVGPINVIEKLDKPLLMLHSKEDIYSTPEYAQKLYDLAGTENKQLVWFEKGRHSMLRITDTERYDNAIVAFLEKLEKGE